MIPRHHKILSQKVLSDRGKKVIRYVLRYNSKLFDRGACKGIDTNLFYPDKDLFSREEERIFHKMCVECPVMEACLEWGLAHERYGVWGGTTPAQRKAVRKRIGWMVSEPQVM